jgi:hypothetical protein
VEVVIRIALSVYRLLRGTTRPPSHLHNLLAFASQLKIMNGNGSEGSYAEMIGSGNDDLQHPSEETGKLSDESCSVHSNWSTISQPYSTPVRAALFSFEWAPSTSLSYFNSVVSQTYYSDSNEANIAIPQTPTNTFEDITTDEI